MMKDKKRPQGVAFCLILEVSVQHLSLFVGIFQTIVGAAGAEKSFLSEPQSSFYLSHRSRHSSKSVLP